MGWIDVIDIEGNTHTFKQSCLRGGKQEPMSQQELEGKFTNNLVFAGLDNQEIESARIASTNFSTQQITSESVSRRSQ